MADRDLLKHGSDGTGMFTVTDVVANDHYTLTRREDYAWGPGDWQPDQPGLPDTVVIKAVSNETTAANLLISGGANAAAFVGPEQQRLRGQQLFRRDVLGVVGELWFNQRQGYPGADENVRRALVQALDLDELSKVLTSGSGKRATGMVPPGLGPCDDDNVGDTLPRHDLDAAERALDTAGWRAEGDGKRTKAGTPLAVTFFYPTTLGPTMQAGAELVQKVWGELGVDVTLKGGTDAEAGQLVSGELPWGVALLPLNVSLPSQAVPFVSGPPGPAGGNFSSIDNPEYTSAVAAAGKIAGTDGCDEWGTAEKALYEQVDVVPFANSTRPMFGKGAEFELSQGSINPATIRMVG
jgi:peptide/nickel transport system substrate-binding protein